jgi:hypothetical protein
MTYKKTGRYIYRNIAGEGVLVPVRDGICDLEHMLLLNETSMAIWEFMQDLRTIEINAIINWLTNKYDVDKIQAKKDINIFLKDLLDARCLECT